MLFQVLHIPCSHATAIQEILHCAQCELELEERFFKVEEEWSEQQLSFLPYKSHGSLALLHVDHTHSLLEQLEHTQIQLATMLMSKYIQPLREEAAQWAAKLANVAEILQKVHVCTCTFATVLNIICTCTWFWLGGLNMDWG